MTSAELIQAFKIGVDKVATLSNPSFEVEEILFFLNKAKDRYEDNLYLGRNSTASSLDENERIKKALSILTESWSTGILGATTPFTKFEYLPYPLIGEQVELPTSPEVKFVLREYGVVQYALASDCLMASDLNLYVKTVGSKVLYERSK